MGRKDVKYCMSLNSRSVVALASSLSTLRSPGQQVDSTQYVYSVIRHVTDLEPKRYQ